MKLQWTIDQCDCQSVVTFVERHKDKRFVSDRIRDNVENPQPAFSEERFWEGSVMCLITSRQPWGPDKPVNKFLRRKPFPLTLAECRVKPDAEHFAQVLREAGLRFHKTIGSRLLSNLKVLENVGWPLVAEIARRLNEQRSREPREEDKLLERWAARAVDEALEGFGPKQSRHLWLHLGLTRYEIPLDSRITRWLREAGFPLAVNANLLADAEYYNFVLDGNQMLCQASNVLPCVLDAAIFARSDRD